MSNNHDYENEDDDDRKDLTRIEDLSEFLHHEDPEVESRFVNLTPPSSNTQESNTSLNGALDLNEIDELPSLPHEAQELSEDLPGEIDTFAEDFTTSTDFGSNGEENSFVYDDPSTENNLENEDISNENFSGSYISDELINSDFSSDILISENNEIEKENITQNDFHQSNNDFQSNANDDSSEFLNSTDEVNQDKFFNEELKSEKLDDVKNFAQNFSYGQVNASGNPPFSVIVRNIKYKEDAQSILSFLKEFSIVNDNNLAETEKALELGSLLIPQISEYTAIILTHKFRRFDCDIEIGLSDEVHPSRSGESNPKGLSKKESLYQNRKDSYKKESNTHSLTEIITSTMPSLEGYDIIRYHGVQTCMTLVEENELERLKYVQKTIRNNSELYPLESDLIEQYTSLPDVTLDAFNDFHKSFDILFIDLLDQLKHKAQKENANALLGINYQIAHLPINKKDNDQAVYQIICSATLASVRER